MAATRKVNRPDGMAAYSRARDLPKLVAFWPGEIADESLAARARVLAKLRRALRAERRRGAAGHWTYDLARHALLLATYHAEKGAYDRARRGLADSSRSRMDDALSREAKAP